MAKCPLLAMLTDTVESLLGVSDPIVPNTVEGHISSIDKQAKAPQVVQIIEPSRI